MPGAGLRPRLSKVPGMAQAEATMEVAGAARRLEKEGNCGRINNLVFCRTQAVSDHPIDISEGCGMQTTLLLLNSHQSVRTV